MYEKIIDKIPCIPSNCLLEICFKCNLNCKHCGSSLNAFKENRNGKLLNKEEFVKVIDDLKELGGEKIGLVGGEPLLCEFWEELASYATNKGFFVSMITNGMLIDEKMAHRIKNSGIKLVAISLDGPEEFHNHLRENPFAYKRVLRAVHSLVAVGIQVNIITTIVKGNLPLLDEIENILSNMEISYWQLQIGIPMGKLQDNKEYVITPEQLKDVEHFILEAKTRKRVQITTADSIGYCSKNEIALRNNNSTNGKRAFIGCLAGCRTVAIESNGNVKGCLSMQNEHFIEGNIREKSLKDIWNDENAFSFNRQFSKEQLSGSCKNCKYGEICRGGCSSLAYNTSGNVNSNEYCLYVLENNA